MNFINCLKLDADRVKIEECEVAKVVQRHVQKLTEETIFFHGKMEIIISQ